VAVRATVVATALAVAMIAVDYLLLKLKLEVVEID
jgi:hypothetical protein